MTQQFPHPSIYWPIATFPYIGVTETWCKDIILDLDILKTWFFFQKKKTIRAILVKNYVSCIGMLLKIERNVFVEQFNLWAAPATFVRINLWAAPAIFMRFNLWAATPATFVRFNLWTVPATFVSGPCYICEVICELPLLHLWAAHATFMRFNLWAAPVTFVR